MESWLRAVVRRSGWVLAGGTLVAAASGWYAATHLAFNTDTVTMLDEALPFRQVQDRYRREFPGLNQNLVLVVTAPTPEAANAAAGRLDRALADRPELFPHRFWPGGLDFLAENGLLLLEPDQLDEVLVTLSGAQPILGRLAQRPSADILFEILADALRHGGDDLAQIEAAAQAMIETLRRTLGGDDLAMSWQRLLAGAGDGPAREILLVEPALDFTRVMAAREAMDALAQIRRDLDFEDGPVTLRITGNLALGHEELVSALEGARLAGLLALLVVLAILYLGLRSLRLTAAALLTLGAGFLVTFGVATLVVGTLNLISIAFAVLYIGLAVNYAIHFLLRYREQLAIGLTRHAAIVASGRLLWPALALSALTTAIGFGAFIPTAYAGVAELGLIAACAMGVTLLGTYTLLPAILAILPVPRGLHADQRESALGVASQLLIRRRAAVLGVAALVAVGTAGFSLQVAFDSDPLNLRDPASESVSTLQALLTAGASGYRNLQLLAEDAQQARALTQQLTALPEVASVMSLANFVPPSQWDTLEMIDATRFMLGPDLLGADWQVPPPDRDRLLRSTAILDGALALAERDAPVWRDLAATLTELRPRLHQNGNLAARVDAALLGNLAPTLQRLTRALQVQAPISAPDLPASLHRQWVGESGVRLLQIAPQDATASVEALQPFVRAVRRIDPSVTGTPVLQTESGRAVSAAFVQAIGWALAGIFLTGAIVLRSLAAALIVLVPLLLGGLATTALMTLTGTAFNFANVIALPLLLGVGIDNGIHLVLRHRAGGVPHGNVLRTHTARAIVFGAATTALSFANLILSAHTGTSSMGFVLAAGLTLIVLATLLVLPAILGPAGTQHAD